MSHGNELKIFQISNFFSGLFVTDYIFGLYSSNYNEIFLSFEAPPHVRGHSAGSLVLLVPQGYKLNKYPYHI